MDPNMMHAQAMGQSPFFYYNPDPNPENRQHGHFTPHPNLHQLPIYPTVPPLPSTPIYSRPNSSSSQPPMPAKLFNVGFQSALTPMASPRPMCHKPAILVQEHVPRLVLDTEAADPDMFYYPSTPPLSSSGSATSSPNSCDILPTPMNTMFVGFDALREGCEGEISPESLIPGDWTSSGSPPLTPVFIQSASLTSSASELLSTASCPSLSPSPSPYPKSAASEQNLDFCDPRNLTVSAAGNPTLTVEFPPLPTLCAGDDEEHKLMLGGDSVLKVPNQSAFDFTSVSHHSLPTFMDEFSDLDSEDDFVNGLVNLPSSEADIPEAKRQRLCSDILTQSSQETFVCDDEFDDFEDSESFAIACLPSPAASGPESEAPETTSKPAKKLRCDEMHQHKTVSMTSIATEATTQESSNAPEPDAEAAASPSKNSNATAQGAENVGTPVAQPTNRRGRKQSLTEDPSKTFVCDLCNRRFRRQEHLKRHYRSLHTQEKPFECNECGKKFSRSDNLAQHARTHGSGAIVMGVLEDGGESSEHGESSDGEYQSYGRALFYAAADASGSSSGFTSMESFSDLDTTSKKKRKRSE